MSSPAATRAPRTLWEGGRPPHFRLGRSAIIVLVAALLFIVAAAVFYTKFWPFSREEVLQDLKEATDSTVTAQSYHPTYFPPGCVLYGVEFRHGSRQTKLIEIQKLRVRGSYMGMLRRHVPQMVAEGAHVFIAPFGSNEPFHTTHSNIVVDELVANDGYVEFQSKEPREKPLRFAIHEATFTGVRWDQALHYHLKFRNPSPPGEITADGKFGPSRDDHTEETPFSGAYTFEHADLGVYGGIDGTLSAKGSFEGVLKQLRVTGSTDTPDFHVQSSHNKFHLTTKFDADVSGLNGDTFLKSVEAHFGRTTLSAQGSIAHIHGQKGKYTRIRFSAGRGRIEDILGLFTTDPSPMAGVTSLTATTEVPPGDGPFLQKVRLEGAFGIAQGSFTKPETQQDVNELSAGARGDKKDDPPTVMTDLKGSVQLAEGIAHFSDLSFGIPGAEARLHGTYGVEEPYRINLHGQMRLETKISKTTSGMKSFLLKIIDPIFKKKKKGEIVPVHVLGTYEKPDFGLDLGNNQDQNKNSKK